MHIYLKYKTSEIPTIVLTNYDYMIGRHVVNFYVLLNGDYKQMKTQYGVVLPDLVDKFYLNLKHRVVFEDPNLIEELDQIL